MKGEWRCSKQRHLPNVKRSRDLSMNVSWKKWLFDDALWVMCLVSSGESKAILLLFETGPHLPLKPGLLNHQQHTILSTVSCVLYKFCLTFSKDYCWNQLSEKSILNKRSFRKHLPWYFLFCCFLMSKLMLICSVRPVRGPADFWLWASLINMSGLALYHPVL